MGQASLFSTAAFSGQLFPAQDRFAIFARVIYPLLVKAREPLAKAYCADNGRPGIEPVLLMGVSLLQFLEGAPDRQAVWPSTAPLGEEVFDPSVLVYFRRRLVEHDLSAVTFASLLEGLIQAALVERRGKRRLDSHADDGFVKFDGPVGNRARNAAPGFAGAGQSAAAGPRPLFWAALMERYVESKLDYRASVETLQSKMDQAGADALELLRRLESLSDQEPGNGPQARLLRRVFEENFAVKDTAPVQRPAQPAGAVQNPHEPEAQWAAKGQGKHKKEHRGYKVQAVQDQPVQKGEPTRNFLTAVVTQPAIASEDAGLEKVEQEPASMGLDKAPELYVDAGYVDAEKLVQAQSEGRDLIGPVQGSPKRDSRFPSEDFAIEISQRQALCQAATNCSRLEEEKRAMITYRFEWNRALCAACALRERCLGQEQKHRTLVVGQHHNALQARRQEQKTEAFKEKTKRRNAIEGTHSELARAHGLKKARYRGQAKVRLQNYLIGAACNAKRWIKRIQWELKQAVRRAAGPALQNA